MATITVMPSGGDFDNLAAALSDGGTTANDIIEISGDWSSDTDTASATVADDNITIRTKVGDQARHAGFDNGGSNYELAHTSTVNHGIQIDNTGCVIDGLLILSNNTGASIECIRMANAGGTFTLLNSVLRAANDTSDQDGVYAGNLSVTVNAENNMVMKFGRAGFHAQNHTGANTHNWNMISNTVWDCGRNSGEADGGGFAAQAFLTGSTTNMLCHNCIAVDNTSASSADWGGKLSENGTIDFEIDNCISSDTSPSARDGAGVNQTESVTLVEGNPTSGQLGLIDITSAPFDLRLFDDETDNAAQDDHANATGATLTIGDYAAGTEDIAGTTRPVNTNYDIGAYEVPGAVGGPTARHLTLLGVGA